MTTRQFNAATMKKLKNMLALWKDDVDCKNLLEEAIYLIQNQADLGEEWPISVNEALEIAEGKLIQFIHDAASELMQTL